MPEDEVNPPPVPSAPIPPPPPAPIPPPPPPPSAPAYLPPATVATKRGIGMRAVAVVAGVALLGGGLAFAVGQAGSGGGASSPEAAVQELFDALSAEDVIGVLDALPAGERRGFQAPLEDISSELQRLGILADGFDLSDVSGIDLQFDDLDLAAEALGEGVSVVHLTGGSVSTAVDPSDLPLGQELLDVIEEIAGEPLEIDAVDDRFELDPDDDALDLVTVEEDGGWSVSLYYSVAEAARQSSGLPAPAFGAGVQPNGQDSPEAAVEALINAAVEELDIEGVIALLPPDEMAALQDYAPLFLSDVEEAMADLTYEGVVEDLVLEADRDGGRATVVVRSADVTVDAEYDDVQVSFDGECVTVDEGSSEPFEQCVDGAGTLGALGELPFGDDIDLPIRDVQPEVGFTTVEVDGAWYVSPTGTVLDLVVAGLGLLEDDFLAALPDLFEDFFGGFASGFTEECLSFDEGGGAIGGTLQEGDDSCDDRLDENGHLDEEYLDDEEVTTVPTTSLPEDPTVGDAPSFEGLTASLVAAGFTDDQAMCVADAVYAAGFSAEDLAVLQVDGPSGLAIEDQVRSYVTACTPGSPG